MLSREREITPKVELCWPHHLGLKNALKSFNAPLFMSNFATDSMTYLLKH